MTAIEIFRSSRRYLIKNLFPMRFDYTMSHKIIVIKKKKKNVTIRDCPSVKLWHA